MHVDLMFFLKTNSNNLINLKSKLILDGSMSVTWGFAPLTEIVNSRSLESTANL